MPLEPSLEDAKFYIDRMDLSKVLDKMVHYEGWLRKDALAVARLYRHYLFLQKKYGEATTISPTIEVDDIWHRHILDTEQYHADCLAIFGRYVHHYPYFGIDGKTDATDAARAGEETLSLYIKEFGDDAYAFQVRGFFSKLLGFLQSKFIQARMKKTSRQ